jgi:hypothetical protein
VTTTILWRRLDLPGREVGRLRPLGDGWEMSGTELFLYEARPCRLDYRVASDLAWRTKSARAVPRRSQPPWSGGADAPSPLRLQRLWRVPAVRDP